MQQKIDLRFSLLLTFVFLAALTRIMPHWPNVTAMGAMALFGAAHFRNRYLAFLVPLLALFVSDLFLNNVIYGAFYDGFVWMATPWVYLGFILIILLGFGLRGRVKPLPVIGAALGGGLLFFMVTNFGSWLADPIYPKNFWGLMEAYLAGVPFLRNSLLGNLAYSALLFGGFAWLQSRNPKLQQVAQ